MFTLHDLADFSAESVTGHRIKINDHSYFHDRWPNLKSKLKLKHLWEQGCFGALRKLGYSAYRENRLCVRVLKLHMHNKCFFKMPFWAKQTTLTGHLMLVLFLIWNVLFKCEFLRCQYFPIQVDVSFKESQFTIQPYLQLFWTSLRYPY